RPRRHERALGGLGMEGIMDDTARAATQWGVNSEYGVLHDVLLCRPEYFKWLPTSSISKATLKSGAKFDHQLAMKQHREMVQAYEDAGVTVHFIEPDEDLPYQVYARDSSFMTPFGAVVTQMHQWWRRGEYAPVIKFYQSKGIPIFRMITAAAFEGGDFDVIEPGAVLIGFCGERTQEPAAQQVKGWMEEQGWEVKLAPIAEHYVHIDLMVCMLGPKLAAVCLDTTDDWILDWLKARKIELVPVNYRDTMGLGCNVMALGDGKILSTAASKELNATLRAAGFKVYDPDMTMFTLGGGGVHCMAQALRRDPV
ncbi:MAG: dimethylarginine dimethylaminohydrolase family protein, partial [Dongiaceae bacterium]